MTPYRFLVDANILLRVADAAHAMHGTAVSAMRVLRDSGAHACVVPQCFYEFWVVATHARSIKTDSITHPPKRQPSWIG